MANIDIGVCFVSSYGPRQCGIATFTQSIVDNINLSLDKLKVIAISEKPGLYKYAPEVIAEIIPSNKESFLRAANLINKDTSIDVVNLQHVFSLFGGKYGENILIFLKLVKKPIITTFHMVFEKSSVPNKFEIVESSYSEITNQIIKLSSKIITIIQPMADILKDQYGVPYHKIEVIPHGTPRAFLQDSQKYKNKLGITGKQMISSFGLIRPKKGLEYAIYAMERVVEKYPQAKLFILGRSHPNRSDQYHNFLINETKRIGLLDKNIFFKNQYFTFIEIINYLYATDIFITPYLVPEQTSSGAIAYAMGCGKAIISTPFKYAREVLADKRGLFINYSDSESIYKAIDFFFSNPDKRKRMERLAYDYAKENSFPNVAAKYLLVFLEAHRQYKY